MPFIVSWPGKIEAGTVSDDLIGVMDMFATVADITGEGLPENKDVAPDSYSFYGSLLGEKNAAARTSIVTADMHGMLAIRAGEWKLVDNSLPEDLPDARRKQIKMPLELQLFNLEEDLAESKNLIETHSQKARELSRELEMIRTLESSR